jgi:uncharacterized repeat protein (TIGR03803 family)
VQRYTSEAAVSRENRAFLFTAMPEYAEITVRPSHSKPNQLTMNFAKTAVLSVLVFFCAHNIHAQGRHIVGSVVTFNGTNGGSPYASLTRGRDGNLYGLAGAGGLHQAGTIFEVMTNNIFTNLAHFAGTNGSFPVGKLLETTNGIFYGTTYVGGSNGLGTIFEYTTNFGIQRLFSFNGTNGAYPWGGMVQASNGNIYGTTTIGGPTFSNYGGGSGSIFVLMTNGVVSNLYYFTNGVDGAVPYGNLVEGTNGDLYGTASSGGANGGGTIFRWKLDPGLDVIASLGAQGGPSIPYAGLIRTRRGTLMGTSSAGGLYNLGVLFEAAYSGQLAILHSFAGYPTDGANPFSSPSCCCCCDGCCDYYGTTYNGGCASNGIAYLISENRDGIFTRYELLHNFLNTFDGGSPEGGVTANLYGNLYVPTITAGANSEGTIDEIFTRPREEQISLINNILSGTLLDVNPGVSVQWQSSQTLLPGSWLNLGTPVLSWSNRLNFTFTLGSQHDYFRSQIILPPGLSF